MASIRIDHTRAPAYVQPAEIYSAFPNTTDTSAIRLRIATGGAGQSGLIRALAEAFIHEMVGSGHEPFRVSWLASDTSASFNYLASRAADLSITYHPVAEQIAIKQGVASKSIYAWRDHWLLVGSSSLPHFTPVLTICPGPRSNPAKLTLPLPQSSSSSNPTTIHSLFTQLFIAAVAFPSSSTTVPPVRFLSRYDKSANNIKESAIWAAIGQTPWSQPYSAWYHTYVEFPFQALRTATRLGEYTLTDRGTWWAVEKEVREEMVVFMEGGDEDTNDVLLNPAHALVGTGVENLETAEEFGMWLARHDGGQEVIEKFEVNRVRLYTKAPNHQS